VIFNVGRLHQPGVYQIAGDGHTVDMFAVNFPTEESELSYLSTAQLRDRVSGASFIPLAETSDPDAIIAGARFGKELWKLFLLLGFLFLLLEMAIAAGGRKPEADTS
jgi:hypothetical protein